MLVSTEWLAAELGTEDLVVLDASLHLPGAGRDARGEFEQAHLPGARFLDLSSLHDPSSSMPGKIPDTVKLESRLVALGVNPGSRIVLYDDSALRTACRAWFILQMFGLDQIAVLDGGLGKWRNESRPLETGLRPDAMGGGIVLVPAPENLRDKTDILANIASQSEQVVDARDAERFAGTVEDHVHGLPGGHIPGAHNLPFTLLLHENGTFRDKSVLRALFAQAGIDLAQPLITTCGSGVTASVLTFALRWLGVHTVALYDGSWSEWGADPDTPKQAGTTR